MDEIKKVFLFLITSLVFACSETPKEKIENIVTPKYILVKTPKVNVDSVFSFVKKQVDFGPRTPNSIAHAKCADWLVAKLNNYGFLVKEQTGTQLAHDGVNLNYRNIIARSDLRSAKRVLLTAHWDTRPWADQDNQNQEEAIDGANDGGSGVAVILEVARLLKEQMPNVGVDIVLFDIEDYGKTTESFCYGSQIWAKETLLDSLKPIYGINLDMVGDKQLHLPVEKYSLEFHPQLVRYLWKRADDLGLDAFDITPQNAIYDDHVPLYEHI